MIKIEEAPVEWKKMKELYYNYIVPVAWMLTLYPSRKDVFKELKIMKKKLEEMGI